MKAALTRQYNESQTVSQSLLYSQGVKKKSNRAASVDLEELGLEEEAEGAAINAAPDSDADDIDISAFQKKKSASRKPAAASTNGAVKKETAVKKKK